MNQLRKLLVFSDDWGRHPSSCQYLIRELLPTTDVVWVNTIGMRPPRVDWITVKRGMQKLKDWAVVRRKQGGSAPSKTNAQLSPTVIDARMWPWMTHSWDRMVNRWLLKRQLSKHATDAVGVTTIPIVADVMSDLPVRKWVYYCVDDFSVWPGLDGQTMANLETRVVEKADLIVSASDNLANRIASLGRSSTTLSHGVHLDYWTNKGSDLPASLGTIPKPWIVFWGLVDRRLNTEWVLALSRRLPNCRVLLVGPQQDPDPRLGTEPNIFLTGPLSIEQLPSVAADASVLIMPYSDLPVTRAMQPLKLKEYMATGRPVVAAALPAVEEWRDCVDVVLDQESFLNLVSERIEGGIPREQIQARQRLHQESWTAKASVFSQLLGLGSAKAEQ